MATVEELVNKANLKNKIFKQEETNTIDGLDSKPGAISKLSFHRDDNDSPTSMFTNEGIESSAIQSVARLMNMWKSQTQERNKNFVQPDDYIENVNKIFSSYQGIRFKIDSAVAFLIGDILNECKIRFFDEDKKTGKKWVDFLKKKISFSVRQAYDFMSISSKLSFIRGKNLTMEQFRALLSLHTSGFEIHKIPDNIESLTPNSILSLKKDVEEEKVEKTISRKQAIITMMPIATKLEKMMAEFNCLILNNNSDTKEKDYILSLKVKLENVLSLINKNIS